MRKGPGLSLVTALPGMTGGIPGGEVGASLLMAQGRTGGEGPAGMRRALLGEGRLKGEGPITAQGKKEGIRG